MKWDSASEMMFHPTTIAVVGVSNSPPRYTFPLGGLTSFCNLREHGFKGRIYPINPRAKEICGTRAYPSITAVPEPIDLVIVAVPARAVPQVLEDCIAAGALNVHVMSSGFGETSQEEGVSLEETIREIALRGKLRLIGPNCMGLQVPSANMSTFNTRPLKHGPVAFMSQSGGHLHTLLRYAPTFGIGFSKTISFGNGLIIDSTDLLEYLGTDPETKIIAMYLEGVRDGRKLVQLVREINREKPVIIWRGGLSASGAQAALSHTGSLRGNKQVWSAFFKQTKAIQVHSIEELADVIMTLLHLRPQHGTAAAILVATGGGSAVAAGDICAEEGIQTPPLTQETRAKLLQFVSLTNQGIANPLDIPLVYSDLNLFGQVLEIIAADSAVDIIILNYRFEFLHDEGKSQQLIDFICSFARENPYQKPVLVSIDKQEPGTEASVPPSWFAQKLIKAGVPAYASLAQACHALLLVSQYHQSV